MDQLKEYLGKRVLITGGGGFIGSNLAERLVDLGSEVRIMDSQIAGLGFNGFNLANLEGKITLDFGDIRDTEAVKRNVINQDIIFNLAAQVGEKNSLANPELDKDINVNGHCNVLDVVFKHNPSARIIFTGSRLQYGKINGSIPVSEECPLNPITPYAKNKVIGERLYLEKHKKEGLQTVVLRIANPYGPKASINNPGYCIVNWFIGRALNERNLPVYGEGSQLRDYIFISDLVEALALAGIRESAVGRVFNVGSGIGTPFNTMAKSIVEIVNNSKSQVKFIDWPSDAKEKETGDFVADITKIKENLGWFPRYSLREGLKRTIDFYKDNQKHYLQS